MSILIVGGDRLGNIYSNLQNRGFEQINHISGRKTGQLRLQIPGNTDLILVLTDYINHELAQKIKKRAKRDNAKVIFSKRSWPHIEKAIFFSSDLLAL